MNDCIFCKIIAGDIPSAKVYEDERVFAFRDLNPMAPVHVLIVPKQHIENVDEIDRLPAETAAAILSAAPKIAKAEGLQNGYRLITNCGADACQSVGHLHFHLLGGRKLSDKMD